MATKTTQERLEKLVLHRDLIIEKANLKGANIPLNSDYPAIIAGIESIILGLNTDDVESLLDNILGEVIAGDYTVKGQAILDKIADVLSSIESKGVVVPVDAELTDCPALIDSIQTGGGTPDWQYPSEWPEIRDVGDDEILLLVTDMHRLRFVLGSREFNVSWGDGTSNDYTGYLPTASHDFTEAAGYTIDPLSGRKLWLVRITPIGSHHLTGFKAYRPYDTYGPSTTPIIAAAFGGQYFTAWYDGQHGPFYNAGYKTYSTLLVYCKIKSFGTATNADWLFKECYALKKVDLPASFGSLTTLTNFFYFCKNLNRVTLPEWGSAKTLNYMFYKCYSLEEVTLPELWGNGITSMVHMFADCSMLKTITLPATWNNVADTSNMFSGCRAIESINLPVSWGKVTNVNYMLQNCELLSSVNLPTSWGDVANVSGFFSNTGITSVVIPPFVKVTNASSLLSSCKNLVSCEFQGWGVVTSINGMFYSNVSLRVVNLPEENANSLVNCSSFTDSYGTSSIIKFTNLDYVGSPTTDTNFSDFLVCCLTEPIALTLYARISRLVITGQNAYPTNITSLRLPNAVNSAFGGSSPQIDVMYTNLDANALNLLFSDLPTVTGKTIRILGSAGAATCDRTIATSKGWTVTG